MGFFSELRNERLIRELQHELNTDILLFGVDGFTYFGSLQAIHDCRVGVLGAATTSKTSNVEILAPGGEVKEVPTLHLDLWSLVGKGTQVVNDPLEHRPPWNNGFEPPTYREDEEDSVERQKSHDLIRRLKLMIGDEVAVTTLGGFWFEGVLSDVHCNLAIIAVDEIFVPGETSSISGDEVKAVVVNLEALTSVSSTTSSRR